MENKIVEYVYLDDNLKSYREEALRSFIEKKSAVNLDFYDLDFLNERRNKRNELLCLFSKSLIDKNITLNKYQIEILNILSANNLFLSAPTSFGKTFIVLEYIYRNFTKLDNIVFIVPTLALMNELVDKISKIFGDVFNICINSQETTKEKNIFIFVPERSDDNFLESFKESDCIDLLVFDEIYKLHSFDSSEQRIKSENRIILMNKVYLQLVKIAKQVVLLGPYIKDVSFEKTNLKITKYFTNFTPVINDITSYNDYDLLKLLSNNPTLIYCYSPESIYKKVTSLIEKMDEDTVYVNRFKKEIDYLEKNYGKGWFVIDLLKRGYAIHHGKTPMFLRKFVENSFREGKIKGIFCTNTLIEGINTPTENLIILESPKTKFNLNNLMGRVGRLRAKNQIIGKIIFNDKEAYNLLSSDDGMLSLNIMAESVHANSNEDSFFFDKEDDDKTKARQFRNRQEKVLNKAVITKTEIQKLDVKFSRLYEIANSERSKKYDYFKKYNSIKSISDALNFAETCVGKTASRYFRIENFVGLPKDVRFISYDNYIKSLINHASIKDLIDDFNSKYNHDLNVSNINVFIDAIHGLINYIKFELPKIADYIKIFGFTKNSFLNELIVKINEYSVLPIKEKILEDLGIEYNDYQKLLKYLDGDEQVSTSSIIKKIKDNYKSIINEELSPFTKQNIIQMVTK